MKTAFDELSDEYDGVVKEITHKETKVVKRTAEQLRVEIVDALYKVIRRETNRAAKYTRNANYYEAKLAEARVYSFHIALGIVIDAATVEVKEG